MINRTVVLQTLKCSSNQYPQMLDEKFPHVLEKVVELWNRPEAEPYIADLLQPNGEVAEDSTAMVFPVKPGMRSCSCNYSTTNSSITRHVIALIRDDGLQLDK